MTVPIHRWGRFMFKIIDYRNTSGKILITVETDDATSALMLRFLSAADKFAELFHYRVTTESRLDASQKTFPEKMARARRFRTDLLRKYRDIPGSRLQRLRILKEMCVSDGMEITLDRLTAMIQIAVEEEKSHKKLQVKRLIRKGKTLNDIALELSIPSSTAARYARAKGFVKPSLLTIVDPPKEERPRGNRYRRND